MAVESFALQQTKRGLLHRTEAEKKQMADSFLEAEIFAVMDEIDREQS